ncbi:sensor histidine kinase [Pseudoroseomonas cervicalis]|uniref:sensor histidine kinase n=1 Tax=Teichococcus cervicalis TaxID=204525 RepID=UPI0022F1A12B|nr:HWE histidine kinase domain-containing protein [Pseudoroseomonas cervicalis]WBV45195.1 PAS domain S-box protein [Pseudoroseomonas cervicalis]
MPRQAAQSLREDGLAGLITRHAVEAIFLLDSEGRTVFANPAAEAMFGWSAEELADRKLHDMLHHHHPDGRPFPMSECPLGRVFETGESLRSHEDVFFHRDGRPIPISCSNAAVLREGRVIGGVLIVRDISERRLYERHRELLLDELNHRVRNMLAVVRAVADQSMTGQDMAAAREAFLSRLDAMAEAQSLLTRDGGIEAPLHSVIEHALRAFPAGGAVRLEGPPVTLPPRKALTLSLAVHELATNATKYGALSRPGGQVRITWSGADTPAQPLRLRWHEAGGPPVRPPLRTGFGTRMIRQALAAEFEAEIDMDFAPEGLVCTLRPAHAA